MPIPLDTGDAARVGVIPSASGLLLVELNL